MTAEVVLGILASAGAAYIILLSMRFSRLRKDSREPRA